MIDYHNQNIWCYGVIEFTHELIIKYINSEIRFTAAISHFFFVSIDALWYELPVFNKNLTLSSVNDNCIFYFIEP